MSIFMKDPPNDPKTLYETREQGSIKLASLGMTSKPKASKREVRHSLDLNPKPFCASDINCNSFAIFVRRIIFTLLLWDSETKA
jgi:hypothetical protein